MLYDESFDVISEVELAKRLQDVAVTQMDLDDLRVVLVSMNNLAREKGIESLEAILPETDPEDVLFLLGMQLAVDGWEFELLENILKARMATYLQEQERRCEMIVQGVLSVKRGENPKVTNLKLKSLYRL